MRSYKTQQNDTINKMFYCLINVSCNNNLAILRMINN